MKHQFHCVSGSDLVLFNANGHQSTADECRANHPDQLLHLAQSTAALWLPESAGVEWSSSAVDCLTLLKAPSSAKNAVEISLFFNLSHCNTVTHCEVEVQANAFSDHTWDPEGSERLAQLELWGSNGALRSSEPCHWPCSEANFDLQGCENMLAESDHLLSWYEGTNHLLYEI